jgi:phosphatidylglycerophosphatase A
MPITTTSNQSSQKENLIDLCTTAGEVFSKFGILLRDLYICSQRSLSNNEQDKQLIGWDEQSATMLRQALQTFAISVRDISTVVAEKRIRER